MIITIDLGSFWVQVGIGVFVGTVFGFGLFAGAGLCLKKFDKHFDRIRVSRWS